MKIKRLKKLKVNCWEFSITWDKESRGACFTYADHSMAIGVKSKDDNEIFMLICHEIMEICAIEMNVRYCRPDCESDFLFAYDHRQHDSIMLMFSGLISQFIESK